MAQWQAEHPSPSPLKSAVDQQTEAFAVPPGYDDVVDHEANFFQAVRSRKRVVENGELGKTRWAAIWPTMRISTEPPQCGIPQL
jgi:hypothetical protein